MATPLSALLRSSTMALFAASLFGTGLASSCSSRQSAAQGDEESSESPDATQEAQKEGDKKEEGSGGPGESGKDAGDTDSKGKDEKSESTSNDDESDPGGEDEEMGSGPKFDVPNPDVMVDPLECDIDFLFIVDNSDSMTVNQKFLANSVPDFIKTITNDIKNLESYHIGVISTDDGRFNHNDATGDKCAKIGGLVVRTVDYSKYPFAEDCGPYANGKQFMTNDDDLNDKFQCAATLGDDGSGNERPMDAMRAAISEDMSASGACNEGFFRKDAVLVVVLVTDEEDDMEMEDGMSNGSEGEPADWYKALLEFKDNRPEYLVVLSLQGLPEPNACEWTYEPGGEYKEGLRSAEVSRRLESFAQMFGERGLVGDVCAENYKPFFDKAVSVIDLACNDLPG